MSCTTSECITTPSSLLRAHAPDPGSLDVCGFPSTSSLCRLPSAPAGPWPFPTLSPQSLLGCLDPYPVVSFRCLCSFLPGRLRPHVRIKTFGTQETPCHAASTGETLSGLQSFVYLQAPMLARPPSCTYRCVFSTGQSGRLHHAWPGSLPIPGCGIATCSTRATNTAGLSPARSRPCRPLIIPAVSSPLRMGRALAHSDSQWVVRYMALRVPLDIG
jgi:hypothetical protein